MVDRRIEHQRHSCNIVSWPAVIASCKSSPTQLAGTERRWSVSEAQRAEAPYRCPNLGAHPNPSARRSVEFSSARFLPPPIFTTPSRPALLPLPFCTFEPALPKRRSTFKGGTGGATNSHVWRRASTRVRVLSATIVRTGHQHISYQLPVPSLSIQLPRPHAFLMLPAVHSLSPRPSPNSLSAPYRCTAALRWRYY